MERTEEQRGERSLFFTALLNGFFPIVIVLSYATLSGFVSLFWTTACASLMFAAVVSYRRRWHEMRNSTLWKYGAAIAFFIGFAAYGLYFFGLESTTPGNASIIVLFEVFTSFVFFRLFKGERFSFDYTIGAVLVIAGALIVLGRGFTGIYGGDLLIFAMTIVAPVGNYFQQKARALASSESVMFLRSVLSLPAIALLAILFGAHASSRDLLQSLPFILINGVVLLGLSKLFWIEAIHRISVTKATALASISPFVTLIFAWLILDQAPAPWQLAALAPFVLGTLLLTDHLKLKTVFSSGKTEPK